MKRLLFFLAVLHRLPIYGIAVTTKSFFTDIPSFRPASPEMVSMNRDRLVFCCDNRMSLDAVVLGGASTNEQDLAQYFLPFGKTNVLVGELGSDAIKNQNADIMANYFGVLTSSMYTVGTPAAPKIDEYTFQSRLTFRPRQQFFGVAITYHHHLSKEPDRGWWGEIILPIRWVRNGIYMEENVITPGGPTGEDPQVPAGFFPNMTTALQQENFKYGKIGKPRSAAGVADPQLKLGYTYFTKESCHLLSYWGAIIPTSNVPQGIYMFEPIYGNNNHMGIFSGALLIQNQDQIFLLVYTHQ